MRAGCPRLRSSGLELLDGETPLRGRVAQKIEDPFSLAVGGAQLELRSSRYDSEVLLVRSPPHPALGRGFATATASPAGFRIPFEVSLVRANRQGRAWVNSSSADTSTTPSRSARSRRCASKRPPPKITSRALAAVPPNRARCS